MSDTDLQSPELSHLKRESQGHVKNKMPETKFLKTKEEEFSSQCSSSPAKETTQNTQEIPTIMCQKSRDRPCFLDHAESYLRQELAALDQHNPKAQDLRLQVCQEVFGFVIDEFKTYKPILSSIKYEYDTTLARLREQIRDLVPLQERLCIVSEQYEKQLLDLRIQGSEEIHALKDECQRLRHIIKRMRDQQNALQTQVECLKDDVAKQYQLYREERDARRLLITKICSIYLTKDGNSENPSSEKLELTACGDDPETNQRQRLDSSEGSE